LLFFAVMYSHASFLCRTTGDFVEFEFNGTRPGSQVKILIQLPVYLFILLFYLSIHPSMIHREAEIERKAAEVAAKEAVFLRLQS
jgi:hypothetical protein